MVGYCIIIIDSSGHVGSHVWLDLMLPCVGLVCKCRAGMVIVPGSGGHWMHKKHLKRTVSVKKSNYIPSEAHKRAIE